MEEKVTAVMHGMQRLPSLMLADPNMEALLKNDEIFRLRSFAFAHCCFRIISKQKEIGGNNSSSIRAKRK